MLAGGLAVGIWLVTRGGEAATVVFSDGFESGDLSAWTIVENFRVQQAFVLSGAWAGRATSPGGVVARALKILNPAQSELYLDAHVNLLSTGGSDTKLLRLRAVGGVPLATVGVRSSGHVWVRNHVSGTTRTSATLMSMEAWHDLQVHARVGGASLIEAWLDGEPLTDLTVTTSLGTSPIERVQVGGGPAAFDAAFDDVVVDTSFVDPSTSPSSSPSSATILAAAGDIACDPADPAFNGGGTAWRCRQTHTAALLAGADAVIAIGDTQYECAGLQAYQQSYDPSWGAWKAITYPVVGNHEYKVGTACGSWGSGGFFSYFGQGAAHDPGPNGYYSFDLGSWHVVVLNSECRYVGGCGQGSPQNRWLEQDLASSNAVCTLAAFHRPRFVSERTGVFVRDVTLPFWEDLYAAGAEVVLNGHLHLYERFHPQDPWGNPDPNGIAEFVVGTGGRSLASFGRAFAPNHAAGDDEDYGILRLTLREGGYDWEFVPEGPSSFSDSGSADCH